MGNTIVSGNRRTFRSTLFGVVMLMFGGTALAADAPNVAPLYLADTYGNPLIDTYGNKIPYKVATGYEANKVAVDSNGNLYVADAVSNTVNVFNTNGKLVRQININRPDAIGIDDQNDRIYVSGAFEGRNIYVLDKNGNGTGTLAQFPWSAPKTITVGSSGDVYVADAGLNLVRRLSAKGVSEKNVYGPFGGEKYAKEQYLKSNVTIDVYRTRHRMADFQGAAVDETRGLLYLSVNEVTEYLDKNCLSTTATVDGTTASDPACYADTGNSWEYYKNLCPDGSCTGNVQTTADYKYWNPVTDMTPISPTQPPLQYHVLVIDINKVNNDVNNNGYIEKAELKKIITIATSSDIYPWLPKGIALDGKGRLYVAAYTSDASSRDSTFGTFRGGTKVYDVDYDANGLIKGTALTPTGSFASGIYVDVVYSPNLNADGTPASKGRLFAATGGGRTISSYSIDGGINPANTAPGKPILLEPVNSAAVNTSTPTLKIRNATDPQNDPLTYGYEIKDSSGNVVTSAAGISGGPNNETLMTVLQGLSDSLYRWHTQSFDGEKATWSDEATFCVDVVNSIPTKPGDAAGVFSPVSGVVSPFGSILKWGTSTDSDCTNDTVKYEVIVSDSRGNIVYSNSDNMTASTSINVSDIPGLVSGNTYTWSVRADDGRGGRSEQSTGSFTYMTTSVTLDSDQAGTKVYIDGNYGYYGKLLGAVPVEKADIAPGSHFVAFINAGYEPYYAIINVTDPAVNAANSSVTYTATMVNASRIKPPATGSDLLGAAIAGGYSSLFIVDHDKDGVKDAIIGGGDGKVSLYRAAKDDTTGKRVLVLDGVLKADNVDINVGSRPVPFAVDYDNDGHQDILVGSGDGRVHLYKGSASGFVAAGSLALKNSDGNDLNGIVSNVAPAVVDYNGDGKKDLVVGSSDGTLRLYINTGSDESLVFGAPAAIKADGSDLNAGSNSRAFFTDWNSDGKKDLLVGDGSGKATLFFNVGMDDAPEFRSISGLQQWIKEKKKERGNRDYVKYLGYNQDLGDLAGGSGEASPFIVDWDGTSARDVIVGNGSGTVAAYITE